MAAPNQSVLTSNLTKYYGKKRGIIDINLNVGAGEVFGYLGPNGAGKTTTIRLLLNFLFPTRGPASGFGQDVVTDRISIRTFIGYLPGDLVLYQDMKGEEFLRYAANLRGLRELSFIKKLAERLQCELSTRISSLSHGNKQKIGLVQAFMHHPRLLILDEPTNGLDPLVQQEFYKIVAEAKQNGQTIFISSHVLPEVERICDRVGIIRDGRLVTVETLESIRSHAFKKLEIHFGAPVPPERFSGINGVRDIVVNNGILKCTVTGELDKLIKAAVDYHIVNIISQEPTLEEVFLTYYGKGHIDA